MHARDDHILIVTRVTHQCGKGPVPVRDAGYVLVDPTRADLQLRPDRPIRIICVQVWTEPRPAPEDRIQIECRGAGVRRDQRLLRHPSCEV